MAWNKEKLDALRAKFDSMTGGDMVNPKYQEVADYIFSQGGNRPAPYAGHPTLLDAPARSGTDDLDGLQVALYGMPMDLGVTNRTGARFGPRALRTMERVGPYNDFHQTAPLHQMAVADIGDVPFRSRFDLHKSLEDIEAYVTKIAAAGVIPMGVGGDHSVTHAVMRALGKDRPVGMIHIDAHCDTGGAYEEEKFHHGGPFRNAVMDGVLDPERCIQIGIRGAAGYIWEFSEVSGMTVIEAKDVATLGTDGIVAKAREVLGDGPTYFTFDIDGLDPAFAPGTGTPEIGGLTTREAMAIIRGLKGLNFIGGDVVEVAPSYDATTNTAHAGAQMLFEILSLIQFSPSLPDAR
ncbi:agmatinase [Rhodospirillaceae bacterium KN72]|uniref:Agmatinase n=1 Tax=Pacificispira spongiicola TaxID=2729598 RepID=A0A7Y0HHM0_9PROT|nr:agmatinase [Pacificispira spongiicola]NMM45624.1 agmatinase [Pacificispira spongiicola]